MRKPSFINLQFFRNRTPPPAFATHHTTEALLPSALHPSVMQVNVRRSAEIFHCHAPAAGSACGSSDLLLPALRPAPRPFSGLPPDDSYSRFFTNAFRIFHTRIVRRKDHLVRKKPCNDSKLPAAVQCLAARTAKHRDDPPVSGIFLKCRIEQLL